MATALTITSRGLAPMLIIFLMLLASLVIMSNAAQNSEHFERFYIWLLLFNALALIGLAGVIGYRLFKVVRAVTRHAPGSRLTAKLVALFVALSMVPVLIVFYFSITFIDRGIDSWFDVRVEKALEDALELARTSLDTRVRQHSRQTENMASDLIDVPESVAALRLSDLRDQSQARELALFGDNNRIVAFSGGESLQRLPQLPAGEVLLVLSQGNTYAALEPVQEDGLHVRVLVPVPSRDLTGSNYILQAIFPVAPRLGLLADSVQDAFAEYKAFAYLRAPLKQSFSITLVLAMLVSVLAALWAALYSANRLVQPIQELAEGTRAVAAGEYHKKLPVTQNDELGFLVRSFNTMTATLAATRDEAERSRLLAESQRLYLQAVLQNLSSGVITLDIDLNLRTANAAASQILECDLQAELGRSLDAIATDHPMLRRIYQALEAQPQSVRADWHEQITAFGSGGRRVLMCHGVWLEHQETSAGGPVLVFDDITALLQAQRDAAWGEVARRLAHEIKNPLTPIQLSAERLEHKLRGHLPEQEAGLLARGTRTIIQQVEAMKTMVNAFGEYARTPQPEITDLDLNQLVREVVELYRHTEQKVQLEVELFSTLPAIRADAGRLRQVLHNLIKNGLEALDGHADARLRVSTAFAEDSGRGQILVRVSDNGPGLNEEMLSHLFEPYVTSKPRGTGLGLAIVKKIVEEHNGMVFAENGPAGGAQVTLVLPVTAAHGITSDSREAS